MVTKFIFNYNTPKETVIETATAKLNNDEIAILTDILNSALIIIKKDSTGNVTTNEMAISGGNESIDIDLDTLVKIDELTEIDLTGFPTKKEITEFTNLLEEKDYVKQEHLSEFNVTELKNEILDSVDETISDIGLRI